MKIIFVFFCSIDISRKQNEDATIVHASIGIKFYSSYVDLGMSFEVLKIERETNLTGWIQLQFILSLMMIGKIIKNSWTYQ
jgi:hypothetical protein